jgi:peptidyl-prolyl cis-trans isomerase B (cyclophilin B)
MRLNWILFSCLFLISTLVNAGDPSVPENPKVKLQTSLGDIVIQLNPEKAPITSRNFLEYVKAGFYDGTIFHRVIPGFMAQGGGFDTEFNQKQTSAPIKNEADNGLKNVHGSVAMARTQVPDSATSQFFINYVDNAFLDHSAPTMQGWGYAVFGQVVEGMDVVQRMESVPTGSRNGHQNVPTTDIVIEKAFVLEP